jgi:hypothetical protein
LFGSPTPSQKAAQLSQLLDSATLFALLKPSASYLSQIPGSRLAGSLYRDLLLNSQGTREIAYIRYMESSDHHPITVLNESIKSALNVITSKLSNTTKEAIGNAIPTIRMTFDRGECKSPVVDLRRCEIILHEAYLSYVWCCCYAIEVVQSNYYKKAQLNQSIVTFHDSIEFPKAMLTLWWGRSLRVEYGDWPTEIANPTEKGDLIQNTNSLYTATVIYLLFHEIGHIVLHSDYADFIAKMNNVYYDKTSEDKQRLFDMEREADAFAFDCVATTNDNEDQRFIKYLGAIMANFTSFYYRDVPDTRGGSHPDLDDRLQFVIDYAKLSDEGFKLHLQTLVSVGLQLFMAITQTEFIPELAKDADYKDFDDLQAHLLGILKNKKDAARNHA